MLRAAYTHRHVYIRIGSVMHLSIMHPFDVNVCMHAYIIYPSIHPEAHTQTCVYRYSFSYASIHSFFSSIIHSFKYPSIHPFVLQARIALARATTEALRPRLLMLRAAAARKTDERSRAARQAAAQAEGVSPVVEALRERLAAAQVAVRILYIYIYIYTYIYPAV